MQDTKTCLSCFERQHAIRKHKELTPSEKLQGKKKTPCKEALVASSLQHNFSGTESPNLFPQSSKTPQMSPSRFHTPPVAKLLFELQAWWRIAMDKFWKYALGSFNLFLLMYERHTTFYESNPHSPTRYTHSGQAHNTCDSPFPDTTKCSAVAFFRHLEELLNKWEPF